MFWKIGCSGFHYKEWKGTFYPEGLAQKDWFEYYTNHFNTLELNVTFYKFPQVAYLKNWFDKSPGGFDFSVKVPRLITHYKQFNDCAGMLNDFYNSIREGLSTKLGAVLFQLPPQAIYTEERLEKILRSVNPGFKNVIEFRHSSWWKKSVMKKLADRNIVFSGCSYPGLPDEPVINNELVYYRFHGVPLIYKSEYSARKLNEFEEAIRKRRLPEIAYVYFNNTASPAALHNARFLKNLTDADSKRVRELRKSD